MATVLDRLNPTKEGGIDGSKLADKLTFKKYKLSKRERLHLQALIVLMSFIATCIGSAWYYLTTQAHYYVALPTSNGSSSLINVWLKKPWDNLPLYIDNMFQHPWFAPLGNAATGTPPEWWYVARHDARHVMIGFFAALLIGGLTVGLKKTEKPELTIPGMLWRVVVAAVVAAAVTAVGVAFFSWHPIAGWFNSVGTSDTIPYVSQFIAKGTIQLTIIGLSAGFAAKKVLARVFNTLQLWSIERNIAQGDDYRESWKRFVYLPNYKKRWQRQIDEGNPGKVHNRWMGIAISVAAPIIVFMAVFGGWLLYFGPAKGA